MNKKIQLTNEGFETLKAELDDLKKVKRPRLVERLSRARDEGDLSENSDYSSAKEELEFLDGRIDELQDVLDKASIIGTDGNGSGVSVGTKVTLSVNGKKHEFEIVGDWQADPGNKKISHSSPLGEALVGRKVGEKVEVEAPAGKITYEILSID